MKKSWFALLALPIAAIGVYGYLSWREPEVPFFPDVNNADGTIDYTLVGKEVMGRDLKLVAYHMLVIRLPKEIDVRRPDAKETSISGPGISATFPANPNGGIALTLNWKALKKAGSTINGDSNLNAGSDDDSLRVHLFPTMEVIGPEGTNKWFRDNCKILENVRNGLVRYADQPTGNGKCNGSPGFQDYYALMIEGQPAAFVQCSQEFGHICRYSARYFERSLMGHFPMASVEQFPDMYQMVMKLLQSATVQQSRTEVE